MTAENTHNPANPDTIVLIHGLWMTPRSWEQWIDHYEGRGYRVLAPAYPGLEVEVEALREDPSPIAALSVPEVVEHYEGIIGEFVVAFLTHFSFRIVVIFAKYVPASVISTGCNESGNGCGTIVHPNGNTVEGKG